MQKFYVKKEVFTLVVCCKKFSVFYPIKITRKVQSFHWIYALLLSTPRLCFYYITIVLGYIFIQLIDNWNSDKWSLKVITPNPYPSPSITKINQKGLKIYVLSIFPISCIPPINNLKYICFNSGGRIMLSSNP